MPALAAAALLETNSASASCRCQNLADSTLNTSFFFLMPSSTQPSMTVFTAACCMCMPDVIFFFSSPTSILLLSSSAFTFSTFSAAFLARPLSSSSAQDVDEPAAWAVSPAQLSTSECSASIVLTASWKRSLAAWSFGLRSEQERCATYFSGTTLPLFRRHTPAVFPSPGTTSVRRWNSLVMIPLSTTTAVLPPATTRSSRNACR